MSSHFQNEKFLTTRCFRFQGKIPASKSLFNRALIIQSYFPELQLNGSAQCDDVHHLRDSLARFNSGERTFYCGEGGTTFRFLALRLSRASGEFEIEAHPQLLRRPQTELKLLMEQLGIIWYQSSEKKVVLKSAQGWQKPAYPLRVSTAISSQFLSGILLNCWNLPFELQIQSDSLNYSYLKMTIAMLQNAGMHFLSGEHSLTIPPGQHLKAKEMRIESDLSSAFTIAALAALLGEATLEDFPFESTQPDLKFVEILQSMNVQCHRLDRDLQIRKGNPLKGIHVGLQDSPDLFPVLAALAAFAEDPSRLDNAPQLIFKESNRIKEVGALMNLMEVSHRLLPDGIEILSKPKVSMEKPLQFQVAQDHRMAMAALIFKSAGYNLNIVNLSVLNKSFPELPEILQNGIYEKNA